MKAFRQLSGPVWIRRLLGPGMGVAAGLALVVSAQEEGLEGPPGHAGREGPASAAPSALGEEDFSALRSASPFRRVLDPAETYALRGYARYDDLQMATLYNKETEQTLVINPDTWSEEGLRLIAIETAPELDGVTAKVSFGGEEVELRYEPSQISPQPRPQSSGDGRRDGDRERRGPSPQDVERFRSLSEENQVKLREYIGHIMRTYPDMSRTERGNMIRGAMIRLTDGRDLEVPSAPSGEGGGERTRGGDSPRGGESSRGGDSSRGGESSRGPGPTRGGDSSRGGGDSRRP